MKANYLLQHMDIKTPILKASSSLCIYEDGCTKSIYGKLPPSTEPLLFKNKKRGGVPLHMGSPNMRDNLHARNISAICQHGVIMYNSDRRYLEYRFDSVYDYFSGQVTKVSTT